MFFLYLSYNTPLTGDDWTWGTKRGMLRLQNNFSGYNGRYLSNLLEIVLTRIDILRYLTIATFSTALIYLLGKMNSGLDNKRSYLLSIILILLMPANIYSQTFGWTAGFVNYVTSLVFLLTFLVITKNIYKEQKPSYPKWLWVPMIPLGIITQLIVEHVTLFAIFSAAFVILYTFFKHRSVFLAHIVYFISLIIGSIIMFTNKAYTNVLIGTDSYRSIREETSENISVLGKIYNAYSGNMYQYLFLDSYMVNIFIGVMMLILILSNTSKTKWNQFVTKPILLFVIIGSLLYLGFFRSILNVKYLGARTNDFEAILSLFFFLSIVISVLVFVKNKEVIIRLLYYISGVILLTAPFVFITPYGPRAALASYVFLVLIGLELYFYNETRFNWSSKLLKPLIYIAIVLILFYSVIFSMIGTTNRERLNYLKLEVEAGAETIHLTELPHSQFLWMSSTKREHFLNMFKEFYNVPEEIEIQFVPYYDEDSE